MLDDSGMENKPHLSEPLPLNKAARCLRYQRNGCGKKLKPELCRNFAPRLPLIFTFAVYNSGMSSNTYKIVYPDEPLPLNKAAHCLRVPVGWLREEVEAGNLPGLKAGRVILCHVPTLAKELTRRAKTETAKAD